ncbi:hypothetical protein VNO77_02149 [Canavalia gladiata]|uniref:Uncharacterized protein n=1 Tax=Canavalia gladiata TaxID=3824 RepID=A0AAN9RB05_CANGL
MQTAMQVLAHVDEEGMPGTSHATLTTAQDLASFMVHENRTMISVEFVPLHAVTITSYAIAANTNATDSQTPRTACFLIMLKIKEPVDNFELRNLEEDEKQRSRL